MNDLVMVKMWEFLHPDIEHELLEVDYNVYLIGYVQHGEPMYPEDFSWYYTETQLLYAYIGKRDFGFE